MTEIGVFRRMEEGCIGFDSLLNGDFWSPLSSGFDLELLRDRMGILDGESGTIKSFPDDLEAADNSESRFGVPIIGDKVVGRDTLCLLGVGVFDRTSTGNSTGATLPRREALAWVLENGTELDELETLCLLGIFVVTTGSLSTCITPFEVFIGGIFLRLPTLCRSRKDADNPTSFRTMFDNVS